MGLKEKAEEDIYFAKRDRELIRALHESDSQVSPNTKAGDTGNESGELGDEDDTVAQRKSHGPGKIAKRLRAFLHKVFGRRAE